MLNTKKAWRILASYGCNFVVCYSEDGHILEYYKEYDKTFNEVRPKEFSFKEYCDGIPQSVAEKLNEQLKKEGMFTEFIQRNYDNL